MYEGPVPTELKWPKSAFDAGRHALDLGERPDSPVVSQPPADPALPPERQAHPKVSLKDRWETRWRVVEAELKARSQRPRARCEPHRPDFAAGFDSVSLKEPRVPRAEPAAHGRVGHAEPRSRSQHSCEVRIANEKSAEPLPSQVRPADAADRPVRAAPACIRKSAPVTIETESPCVIETIETCPAEGLIRDESAPTASQLVAEPKTETVDKLWKEPSDPATASESQPSDADVETPVRPTASARNWPGEMPRTHTSDGEWHALRWAQKDGEGRTGAFPEPRKGAEPVPNLVDWPEVDRVVERVLWPSAKDILATHGTIKKPQGPTSSRERPKPQSVPTWAREPAHWSLPAWVAGPPAAAFVLAVGLTGFVLSWWWALDSYSASIMTGRLLTAATTAQRGPLPESVAPPEGTWIRSTAQHLAHWAIFLCLTEAASNPPPREAEAILNRALQVSPLNPTARLALAQLEQSANGATLSLRGLGLSRDAVSLSWCAQRLMAAGKKDDAKRMYGKALTVATVDEPPRGAVPRFSDDPAVSRYLLPGEDRVRDIVRELLATNEWTFGEWSATLPRKPTAALAAARLLREQGRSEADTLLELILDDRQPLDVRGAPDALALAARAEAFALKSRWRDALELYRRAIEQIDDETTKRSWWFNLADVALKLDDEGLRQDAFRAALAVANSDDIARRVTDIQRSNSARPRARSRGAKAN